MASGQSFTINIKALLDTSSVKSKVTEIQNAFSKIRLPDNLNKQLNESFVKLNKALVDYDSKVSKGVKTKADANGINSSVDNIIKEFTKLENIISKVKTELGNSVDLSQMIKFDDKTIEKINILKNEIKNISAQITESSSKTKGSLEEALNKITSKGARNAGQKAIELFNTGNIKEAIALLEQAKSKQQAILDATKKGPNGEETNIPAFNESARTTAAQNIQVFTEMGQAINNALTSSEQLVNDLNSKTSELAGTIKTATSEAVDGIDKADKELVNTRSHIQGVSGDIKNLTNNQQQFVQEVDQVKSRIQYFFGLSNSINLIKRAIRGAVDTIKDLDKAMTETAVVTDFTVSDMWKQLPEYTKRANELGVTTLQAYQSATLFYQQGLNSQQAAELSTETLKMARIAGLDAAEATDRMTNALRGFNMALDADSAQRVDDVYSQLAAHTASNVDEISTAMTKVASLAHSANMEFETTAAFLAQIIETTRESAETAGTALKTVVARFSEVKKLYSEDQLRGSDEEGQVIDVNKISTALRTAGIDLNKYFLGEVGLDDIFMELASKWDSLTSVQQRYIATQAAGSRQQSRFIALMQDYARTQDLVSLAYNSEGASARQFAKTQESLQSKTAKLKNAWNEFLMGLTNNKMVKTIVDGLTLILNFINKITSSLGEGLGTIAKWGIAFGGLAGARGIFSEGGIGTQIVSGIIGHGFIANKIRETLGLGKVDEETGEYKAFTNKKGKSIGIFNGGLFSGWRDSISKFKADNVRDPVAYKTFKDIVDAGETDPYYTQQMQFYGPSKTLFGALGNKFITTGIGGKLSALLGGAGGATTLAVAIGGITAAAVTAAAAIKAVYDASPEGQLKNAQKLAESMESVAANAKSSGAALKKVNDQNKEYTDLINKAATISERDTAIQNRNDYITSLLEQDATYAQYLSSTFKNGQLILTLDEKALAAAADDAAKSAEKAAIGANFAQAAVAGRQANLYNTKLSAAGVNLKDKTIRDWEDNQNYSVRAMTDKEYAKYAAMASDAQKAQIQMQNQAKQAYSQLIDADKLGDDLAESLASALSKTFDGSEIDTKNWSFLRSRSHWQEEYLNLYGVEADANLKTADIARAVGQGEYFQGQQGKVNKVQELLTGENSDFYKNILNAFEGIGESADIVIEIPEDQIKYTDILEAIGIDTESDDFWKNYAEIAEIIGPDELSKGILEAYKLNQKLKEQITKQTLGIMRQNGGYTAQSALQYQNLKLDERKYVGNIVDQFKDSDIGSAIVSNIMEAMEKGEWENSELQKWIDNLDFSNPIEAFDKIEKAASSNVLPDSITKTAKAIQGTNDYLSQFGNTAQLSYFLLSESYGTLESDLNKFIDANEKITSSNINELAKSNSQLNTLIENNIISAEGLARVLTGIQSGTISVLDLNDAIIAAASSMDSLDSFVQDTINDLNNFDAGFDENDVVGFINKALKVSKENLEKGAYGNNVMANYMQKIFGDFEFDSESAKKYNEQYKDWLNEKVAWLEANQENMHSAWSDFIKYLGEETLNGARIYEQNGEILIEANKMTTEQLVQAMVETGNVTRTQAEMMIADYKNNSADFKAMMAENDLPNAIEAWSEKLRTAVDGKKIYAKEDIDVLSKITGLDPAKIEEYVKSIDGWADKYKEITWDDNGERTKDIITQNLEDINPLALTKGSEKEGEKYFEDLFNYDRLKKAYDNLGIPEWFKKDFDTILDGNKEFVADFFGEPTKVAIKEGQTATQAYEEAYQKALADLQAKSIGDVLENLITQGVVFEPNHEAVDSYEAELESKEITVPVKFVPNGGSAIGGVGTVVGEIRGAMANGGIVSAANGTVKPGPALTGEEDPEIVWNKEKGYAYLAGKYGPEINNLQPGDQVFNARQTKNILHRSGIKSFAKGTINSYGGIAHGYGSSISKKVLQNNNQAASKKAEKEWQNTLDWLYNLMEDISELERIQTDLSERHDRYLEDISKTGRDLYNLTNDQLNNLYTQRDNYQEALTRRMQEMREQISENDLKDYVWWNDEDKTIEIDWDKINTITDKDQFDKVSDLVSKAEKIQDQMDEAEKALWDIEGKITELKNRYLQEFIDLQKRVYNAVVNSYQEQIDALTTLNDTINNSNEQILNSLQKEIELQRQIRENTDTENNIKEMEARLAYLRRDTTGANASEILSLEKELEEARKNYTDSLIDQAIDKLQKSNEDAAEQRRQQIELLKEQLDYWKEIGAFWPEVAKLLDEGINGEGSLIRGSTLEQILRQSEGWNAMSEQQREVWANELINSVNQAGAYLIRIAEGFEDLSQGIWALIPESSIPANKRLATGGLISNTGPAWLDGTYSEPEYVLSARQTDAFLKLADILPSMFNGSGVTTTNNLGNNIYVELNMSVGEIGSDYDVDRLVERVKEDIYNTSSYRNVNAVSFLR